MIRALRSEWSKLMRPGTLLAGAGTIVALCLLVVILVFANAQQQPMPSQRGGSEGIPSLPQLADAKGLTMPFTLAGQLLGVVSLVLFAQGMGGEYTNGTLKVQLSREPRRLVLLGGKTVAMAGFVAAAIVVAFLVQSMAAPAIAGARGLDTSAWWSADGLGNAVAVLGRIVAGAMVWGLMGTLLGILFRSAAPAIGIGIGYTLVGEPILALVWDGARKVLPGQLLAAFARGGTPEVSLAVAATFVALYAGAFALAAGAVFWRRDVST